MRIKLLIFLLFSICADIFFVNKLESNSFKFNKYNYRDEILVKNLSYKNIYELRIEKNNIKKILETLKRYDKKNAPKKVIINGKIKYTYKKLPNEPKKSIQEIEDLINNPLKTEKYEIFIKKAFLNLSSNGIKIYLKDLEENDLSGQWIHKEKSLIINKKILKEGTKTFAYLLSHEMIHVTQSCKAGGFDYYPSLLGLVLKEPKSFYYKYLESDIYQDLTKSEIMLEIEAYANQRKVLQTMNLFKYYCLNQK